MSRLSQTRIQHILLADDDNDDCLLFKDALEKIPLATHLTTVRNGEQLMQFLNSNEQLPDILFLDLNMPRKNGFECLSEIKTSKNLKQLPVIMISTSFEPDIVNLLHRKGAHYYICKPNSYEQLVRLVHRAIAIASQGVSAQPPKEEFVLSLESCYNESPVSNRDQRKS